MVDHIFRKQVEIDGSLPTWSGFQTTNKVPKSKATYHNGVPRHLINSLPPCAQWPLIVKLCHAWQDGHLPLEWAEMRISLLYKKGGILLPYRCVLLHVPSTLQNRPPTHEDPVGCTVAQSS